MKIPYNSNFILGSNDHPVGVEFFPETSRNSRD